MIGLGSEIKDVLRMNCIRTLVVWWKNTVRTTLLINNFDSGFYNMQGQTFDFCQLAPSWENLLDYAMDYENFKPKFHTI